MNQNQLIPLFTNALIVDDSEEILEYFKIILQSLGAKSVTKARNGEQALDAIRRQDSIDLILCDINMPQMDGIEFLRYLADDITYTGNIVLVSGEHRRVLDSASRLATAHGINILGALHKPVGIEQLQMLLTQELTLYQKEPDITSHDFTMAEFHSALARKEFIIHLQPKVDVRSLEVIGAEALARWLHPELGLIGASAFVPFLEEKNLIYDLTDVLLDQAIQCTHEICQTHPDFKLAINICADSLDHWELPNMLHNRCRDAETKTSNIIFEITENRIIKNFKLVLEIMTRLHLKGFGLSIDDFGTGFSSMTQLQNFPFQELKIDKSFITGASRNHQAQAIIESSISLARKLDMHVVAEGVETKEDLQLVTRLGCDTVQGYLFAKPMPVPEFINYISSSSCQAAIS